MRARAIAALFCGASIFVLVSPIAGPHRWVGLVAFVFVGIPWYLLTTMDAANRRIDGKPGGVVLFPSLFFWGVVLVVFGALVDYLLIREMIAEPTPGALASLVGRAVVGVPFIGFGVYLVKLALGRRDE